ncbi:hypothetical protein D4764_11G0007470 [Takifugu flavidus]|uniref:Uncharacterized protein n=1 Tax=Takifugu flavidus TaxID=433684 RepID=A0A5C6PIA7_9TELE|nr:hypothetical protein D4764_11G0007470 [Takifugu flavidus]
MGQRFAPSYANLYMSEWEREALTKCPLLPTLYLRYLDDILSSTFSHTQSATSSSRGLKPTTAELGDRGEWNGYGSIN